MTNAENKRKFEGKWSKLGKDEGEIRENYRKIRRNWDSKECINCVTSEDHAWKSISAATIYVGWQKTHIPIKWFITKTHLHLLTFVWLVVNLGVRGCRIVTYLIILKWGFCVRHDTYDRSNIYCLESCTCSNSAIFWSIQIGQSTNQFHIYLCSSSHLESIWISGKIQFKMFLSWDLFLSFLLDGITWFDGKATNS